MLVIYGRINFLRFSANLGFLWTHLTLPDAILEASKVGFDAVECHWPFDFCPIDVRSALNQTNLPMICINTRPGNIQMGDFGLSAVFGRENEARSAIAEAFNYAISIEAKFVHVMAGLTNRDSRAEATYQNNLCYAADLAQSSGIQVLIEPINQTDVRGYHLSYMEDAISTIKAVNSENIKLMFDCYHCQIMQGDLIRRLVTNLSYIGHVQIAGVPDRGEPHAGELSYKAVLKALQSNGYRGYIGAEYKPRKTLGEGLTWLNTAREWCK